MPICLADWNIGMDDAEAGALRRSGMPPDYYGGYGYACALNYEYMALGREPQVSRALATMQASHQIDLASSRSWPWRAQPKTAAVKRRSLSQSQRPISV